MRVIGHSLAELDVLRAEFDPLVEKALYTATTSISQRLTTLTNASSVAEDAFVVAHVWETQVDEVLVPHIAAIYDGASLSVAYQVAGVHTTALTADGAILDPGFGIPMVPPDPSIEYLRQARNRLQGVSDAVWGHVRDQLTAGVAAGESVEQLALRVQAAGQLSLPRARVVARTEVNGASNAGAYAQLQYLGMTGVQEWLATDDTRTREDHALTDGQKVALDATFNVGGWQLRWPGDPAAPASETANCRCTVAFDLTDDPPQVTCNGLAVTAAGFGVKPSVVSTSNCVMPPNSVPAHADTALLDDLTEAERKYVYQTFQYPKAISPAYGGAKIHKQVQATIDALAKTGKPQLIALGPHEIVHVVDEFYKQGKFTFKDKYDEWLGSPAGAKVAPHLAVKVETATSKPITPEEIFKHNLADFSVGHVFAEGTDASGQSWRIVKEHDASGDFYGTQRLVNGKWQSEYVVWGPHDLGNYKVSEWHTPSKTSVEPDAVPGKTATVTKATDDVTHKVTETVSTPPVTPPPPPVVKPVTVAAPDVKAPVLTDKGHMPLAQQAGDISAIPDVDQEAFYQAFKKQKVTAVWSGNKIWDALQATKAQGFHFNDLEALKILDKKFAQHGGSTGYVEKMTKWESSPAGKKVLGEVPAGVTVTPAAGTTMKSPPIDTKMPGPTSTTPVVDISTVPADLKHSMLVQLNSAGPLLTKPPATVYKKIVEIRDYAKTQGHALSDLDVLRILDAEKAAQLGVPNAFLYEKKIVEWLKTPSGKATAKKYATGVPAATIKTAPTKTTPTISTKSAVELNTELSQMLANARAKISTTDTTFPEISVSEAHALQSQMTATSGVWTAGQRAALKTYTGSSYSIMNNYLRGKSSFISSGKLTAIQQAQAGMRPSTRPIVVHRGTGFSQFGGTHVDASIVGKVFKDEGFMSTSVGGAAAFGGQVLLEIQCPTGTPMAFVKSISQHSSEDELLLAAGTRYRVISVTQSTGRYGSSVTKVTVRVIP